MSSLTIYIVAISTSYCCFFDSLETLTFTSRSRVSTCEQNSKLTRQQRVLVSQQSSQVPRRPRSSVRSRPAEGGSETQRGRQRRDPDHYCNYISDQKSHSKPLPSVHSDGLIIFFPCRTPGRSTLGRWRAAPAGCSTRPPTPRTSRSICSSTTSSSAPSNTW